VILSGGSLKCWGYNGYGQVSFAFDNVFLYIPQLLIFGVCLDYYSYEFVVGAGW
jgi:hypothetical protein